MTDRRIVAEDAISLLQISDKGFGRFVHAKEEGGTGRRTGRGGANSPVDATKASRGEESLRRLQASFDGVDGEEGDVDAGSGTSSGQEGGEEGRLPLGGRVQRLVVLEQDGFVGIGAHE